MLYAKYWCGFDADFSRNYDKAQLFAKLLDCSFLTGIAFAQLLLRSVGNLNQLSTKAMTRKEPKDD